MEHTEVFRPWDADDIEYEAMLTAREMLPDHVRPAVMDWLDRALRQFNGNDSIHLIQTSLHVDLELDTNLFYDASEVLDAVVERGDRFLIRTIDLLLATQNSLYESYNAALTLDMYLSRGASSIAVTESDEGPYRITRRLPDGVEQVASTATETANEAAGRHLASAWRAATAFDADASKAMVEAIRAVEAAAGPVITPKEQPPRLGKIVAALKDSPRWRLTLQSRDDGHPDHRLVLIGMLETLAFAQRDRHGGEPAAPVEAMGHVQLASTLVSWFSTGVVTRETSA
ncbi:hypothetical protein ACIPY5_14925 [Microbacterium sp. NPDC089698]|uniref:hypothetical protein n=1 Tax=Microbacterium sp. NPDC089698 TaxID=3364200 RepID=UPI00380629A5